LDKYNLCRIVKYFLKLETLFKRYFKFGLSKKHDITILLSLIVNDVLVESIHKIYISLQNPWYTTMDIQLHIYIYTYKHINIFYVWF